MTFATVRRTAALAGVALVIPAATAQAAPVKLTGGKTVLTLDPGAALV